MFHEKCEKVHEGGTVDFALNVGGTFSYVWVTLWVPGASSELAMPLDSTAECAEKRRELKTVSKLCAFRVLRGDNALAFRTVAKELVKSGTVNARLLEQMLGCDMGGHGEYTPHRHKLRFSWRTHYTATKWVSSVVSVAIVCSLLKISNCGGVAYSYKSL